MRIRSLAGVAVAVLAACSSKETRPSEPGGSAPVPVAQKAETVSTPTAPSSLARIRITRTIYFDDHVAAGGAPPALIHDGTPRVVIDETGRSDATRPVVRRYTARIDVPATAPAIWELDLGDDYRLMVATAGFHRDGDAVVISGRTKSNYAVALDGASGATGPGEAGFGPLAPGQGFAIQVLDQDGTGQRFREFEEVALEAIVAAPDPGAPPPSIVSTEEQPARWASWSTIRKRSLR